MLLNIIHFQHLMKFLKMRKKEMNYLNVRMKKKMLLLKFLEMRKKEMNYLNI